MDKKKEEKKTITLFIEVKEIKSEKGNFTAYKTPIGKLNLDVKFNKEAEKPEESGYYTFNIEDLNLNTQKDYPCLWIRK